MSNRSNFSPHEDMYMSACSLNKLPWELSNFHSLGLCSLCSKFFIYTLFPLFVTSFPLLFYFTSTFFSPVLIKMSGMLLISHISLSTASFYVQWTVHQHHLLVERLQDREKPQGLRESPATT